MPGLVVAVAGLAGSGGGCSVEPEAEEGPCVVLDADCEPLYEPTFEQVFSRTLQPTCGAGNRTCHSADGAQGGLIFAEMDASYDGLLGEAGGGPQVIPGDAECSSMMRRLETSGPSAMPPGDRLSAAERCSVGLWIRNGAPR